MRWETKLKIGVIGFIFFVGLFSVYSFIQDTNDEKELLAETKVEIIRVEPKVSRETDGLSVWDKLQSYTVSYRYELNGQKIERTEDMPRNTYKYFKVGDTAKICYNPQNPDRIKLVLNTQICGK